MLPMHGATTSPLRRARRWHIAVFLAPALLVYTAIMIIPLADTLRLSLFRNVEGVQAFVGLDNFRVLFFDPRWSVSFWNALGNNVCFFIIHMLIQNPIGVAACRAPLRPEAARARLLPDRDLPADHALLRHRRLYLEAHPVAALGRYALILDAVGLKWLFAPWLGQE